MQRLEPFFHLKCYACLPCRPSGGLAAPDDGTQIHMANIRPRFAALVISRGWKIAQKANAKPRPTPPSTSTLLGSVDGDMDGAIAHGAAVASRVIVYSAALVSDLMRSDAC